MLEQPGAAWRSQEPGAEPGAASSSQEQLVGARRSQEQPGGATRGLPHIRGSDQVQSVSQPASQSTHPSTDHFIRARWREGRRRVDTHPNSAPSCHLVSLSCGVASSRQYLRPVTRGVPGKLPRLPAVNMQVQTWAEQEMRLVSGPLGARRFG